MGECWFNTVISSSLSLSLQKLKSNTQKGFMFSGIKPRPSSRKPKPTNTPIKEILGLQRKYIPKSLKEQGFLTANQSLSTVINTSKSVFGIISGYIFFLPSTFVLHKDRRKNHHLQCKFSTAFVLVLTSM